MVRYLCDQYPMESFGVIRVRWYSFVVRCDLIFGNRKLGKCYSINKIWGFWRFFVCLFWNIGIYD